MHRTRRGMTQAVRVIKTLILLIVSGLLKILLIFVNYTAISVRCQAKNREKRGFF